jgi:hypothetical protein
MTGWEKVVGFCDEGGELLGSVAGNFIHHLNNY